MGGLISYILLTNGRDKQNEQRVGKNAANKSRIYKIPSFTIQCNTIDRVNI